MKFLGLRLDEHDSNVTYTDGKKVKYFKSERYHQVKHHGYNNLHQWQECLKLWDVKLEDIDAIAIVIDPEWHVNESFSTNANFLYEQIKLKSSPFDNISCPVFRVDHHYAHALSLWPLVDNINTHIVMDGWGDHEKSFSFIQSDKLLDSKTVREMESVGRIFAEIGFRFGMKGHAQDFAGKLMGLKSYGKIREELLSSFKNYTLLNSSEIYSSFENDVDWLCTIHNKFEKLFPEFFKKYISSDKIFGYSGGVAQNTVINSEIKKQFKNIHIPPHCPDEGLSLGCVEFLRKYYNQEIFDKTNFPFWQSDESPTSHPSDSTIKKVSEYLANGKIIAWYQGNGEVGPRALGNRSILMNPSIKNGKQILNEKVKHREYYRPFGASILKEEVSNYFNWHEESPYMLYVADILTDDLPSITHIDNTCRMQTVSESQIHFRRLIESFKDLTGIPILLNTSLNVGGKPIAGNIEDAVNLYKNEDVDVLVVGDEIVSK